MGVCDAGDRWTLGDAGDRASSHGLLAAVKGRGALLAPGTEVGFFGLAGGMDMCKSSGLKGQVL